MRYGSVATQGFTRLLSILSKIMKTRISHVNLSLRITVIKNKYINIYTGKVFSGTFKHRNKFLLKKQYWLFLLKNDTLKLYALSQNIKNKTKTKKKLKLEKLIQNGKTQKPLEICQN